MPSTLVHLAVGGLVAVSLLRKEFGWWSLGVVLAFAALPDVDTFIGLFVPGAHRSLLHSLFVPIVLGGLLIWDVRRDGSLLADRFTGHGARVGAVAILALAFGGIGPDLVTNGVNVLYPLHDTFLSVSGEVKLSSSRGLVQTFVDVGSPDGGGAVVGSTETVHYSTGVDPTPGAESPGVDRVFPIVDSGFQLLLVVMSTTLVAIRLREAKC